jgi:hypothetical protein
MVSGSCQGVERTLEAHVLASSNRGEPSCGRMLATCLRILAQVSALCHSVLFCRQESVLRSECMWWVLLAD